MQTARRPINIDLDLYEQIDSYCAATGVSKANVIREAISMWLVNVKPRRMAAFGPAVITKAVATEKRQ